MNRRQMVLGLFGVSAAVAAGKGHAAPAPLPVPRDPISFKQSDLVMDKFRELAARVEQDHAEFIRHVTAKLEFIR